jgi:hypothetical protein
MLWIQGNSLIHREGGREKGCPNERDLLYWLELVKRLPGEAK